MKDQTPNESDLMTIDQVALNLNVNPITVRRRMVKGEFGNLYRNGKKCVRIYRENYEHFVFKNTVEFPLREDKILKEKRIKKICEVSGCTRKASYRANPNKLFPEGMIVCTLHRKSLDCVHKKRNMPLCIELAEEVREQVCKSCGHGQAESFDSCPECGEEK